MANSVNTFSYAGTNVTTGAYVTFIASTAIPITEILATDTSGALVKLAVGVAGSEVDLTQMPVSGTVVIPIQSVSLVPVGSRISLKAVSATASTGYAAVTLLS